MDSAPRHSRLLWVAVLIVFCATAASVRAPSFRAGVPVGQVNSDAIAEASGLAASRLNPGVLWVHNDAGFAGMLFAISTNGQLLSFWQMPGAPRGDFEDIAMGTGPASGVQYIYLGDIGDNYLQRSNIRIFRMPEPVVPLDTADDPPAQSFAEATQIILTYPDTSHNAEALMSDPMTGDLFIATKGEPYEISRIYRAPKEDLDGGGPVQLQFVRALGFRNPSGGDISSDGREIVLRRSSEAGLWRRTPGQTVGQALAGGYYAVPVVGEPLEANGEGITFHPAGLGYYTISEGYRQPIHYFQRSSAQPTPGVFSRMKSEQRIALTLRGQVLDSPEAKPTRFSIKTRQLIQAIGQELVPGATPFQPNSTLRLITSPAGTQRLVVRQSRLPDVDVTGFFPTFDLGNDRPDAVIIQKYPGAPRRIYTAADFLIQFGAGDLFLDLGGPAGNRTKPITVRWLGTEMGWESTQSSARASGWLLDSGDPAASLAGVIKVGAARLVSVPAFLAEDFDVWDGRFMVVNTGPVERAWTRSPAAGGEPGHAWRVDGTQMKGVPTASALLSPMFFISKSGPAALLFEHRYCFQADGGLCQDGGQIRVRINDGPFQTVPAGAFVLNGYTGTVGANNMLRQEPAFAGLSPGYDRLEPILSAAVLGDLQTGDLVTIQFVAAWDEWFKGAEPNWQIDNVAVIAW